VHCDTVPVRHGGFQVPELGESTEPGAIIRGKHCLSLSPLV